VKAAGLKNQKIARIAKSSCFKKKYMLKALLRILSALPLPVVHGLGIMTGMISYLSDRKFSRRIRNNLASAGIASDPSHYRSLVRQNVAETGKGILETFAVWFRSPASTLKWVRDCHGWQFVDQARLEGKGIIFLTPHLGCYEITALYYAARHPITVLYRPPRQRWLAPLIEAGRSRSQITLAATNMGGVRNLLKTLRKGDAIGILPDQVPESGEGVWADFFGKPAYTMSLVTKLAEATGATVLMAFGERLSWGRGFVIHIEPLGMEPTPSNINLAIERLVKTKPAQYLWSYRRYKQPRTSRNKGAAT
jgi:KDO2-lipid IV(A) lauroyltransferase